MILFSIVLVVLSFVISALFTRKISFIGASLLSCVLLLIASILAYFNFQNIVLEGQSFWFNFTVWIDIGVKSVDWEVLNDNLAAIMCIIVLTVSGLVHFYSKYYMEGDPHICRFFSYLSLFTALMLVLVSSGNMIQLFIGWEGVGICSYLLVSFWNTRNSAVKSALKAIVVNRFGDVGFIMTALYLFIISGSLQFEEMEAYFNGSSHETGIVAYLVLIAITGKSAQFGLHSWLPDAMEGPTPVSALIHAATMVTAGIFLIVKLSFLFNTDKLGSVTTIIIGSLTAVFAASVGLLQNDFKKVIAYSTCSQLGYMALIAGVGEFSLSLFHLFNHAFFKALLFLSAGSIIHALADDQDFRKGSVLIESNPLAFTCVLVGSLSLMGLPFLTGFYSKDLIIEMASQHKIATLGYWLALLSALFTASYSFRLICTGLLSSRKSSALVQRLIKESSFGLNFSLLILSFFSVSVGYMCVNMVQNEYLPLVTTLSKQFPLLLSVLGSLIVVIITFFCTKSWERVSSSKEIRLKHQSVSQYLRNAWNYDNVFHWLVTERILRLGDFFYQRIDRQGIEFFGPWQFSNLSVKLAKRSSFYNTGVLFNYLFSLLIFLIAINSLI